MTNEKDEGTFFAKCFYFQIPNGSATTINGYFALPSNVSELNDYMCGPMNRKGLVCSECIDGFGPSITSLVYMCANCSSPWSGILLYVAVEFVPTMVFYLIVLTFRISMTSAPMTCFVWFSQLTVYILFKDHGVMDKIIVQSHSESVKYLLMFTGSFYGIWNLDILKYALPPLCISSKLSIIHIELLECISSLNPLFLIFVTWFLVEVHDCNFRPIVLAWKPFHRCFVRLRKGYDTKTDIIDVFATFLLLTYSKLAYQSLQILGSQYIVRNGLPYRKVQLYDPTVGYMSGEHLPFVIIAVVILIVLVIPPPFILLLYPTKACRACLIKCRLDGRIGVILHTFVEKFFSCYKDGSNGGYDMRGFSALYFLMRPMVVIIYVVRTLNWCEHVWFLAILLFTSASLLIAFVKPYKKIIMNLTDSLLLALISLFCLLAATEFKNVLLHSMSEMISILIPMGIFLFYIVYGFICKCKTSQFINSHVIEKVVHCFAGGYNNREHQRLLSPYHH